MTDRIADITSQFTTADGLGDGELDFVVVNLVNEMDAIRTGGASDHVASRLNRLESAFVALATLVRREQGR